MLAALGCPVGEKSAEATVVLPGYLSEAPERTRRAFVGTYLLLRGHVEDNDGHDRLRLREARSERYLRSLASLFAAVLDGDVWQHGNNVVLSAAAGDAYRAMDDPLA